MLQILRSKQHVKIFYSFSLRHKGTEAKPFNQIPSISLFKLFKESLPGGRYYKKSFTELMRLLNAEYGNIIKFPALLYRDSIVFTCNPDDFEKVYRAEGMWPERSSLLTLEYYRKTMRPDIYGEYGSLFSSQGETWYKMRTIVNPILMQPKKMNLYCSQIDTIAKEFVQVMRNLKEKNSEMPKNFNLYLSSWSLESVAIIALEKRLNLLNDSKDPKALELLKRINLLSDQFYEFEMQVSLWKYYQTKAFKDFMKSLEIIDSIILDFINEAVEKLKSKNNSTEEDAEESILSKLLKIDKKIAVVVASDLLLAGVDTTSNSASYILYCLANNPEKQEILRNEIMKILPSKSDKLTPDNMRNMPYLRAVIKESFRLFPLATGTLRKLPSETILSGYKIPANTHVATFNYIELKSEKQFSQPEKFIPERWLRHNNDQKCPSAKNVNPFIVAPFGVGSRACIGKRLAELELEAVTANVVRNFKLEWRHPDLVVKSAIVIVPNSELRFKITEI